MPTGFTWARSGTRPLVRYEAPKGRRVNAIGALAPFGDDPKLAWATTQDKIDAGAFLAFVCDQVAGLPGGLGGLGVLPPGWRRERRCVVVLDNYSVHRAKPVKDVLGVLERVGVELYFLPPYSPELNLIEAEWRQVKYQDSPVRSHLTGDDLQAAVEAVLARRAARFHQPTHNFHEAA